MSYRKITKAAVMDNSVSNLVLRQQWALHFLRLDSEGTRRVEVRSEAEATTVELAELLGLAVADELLDGGAAELISG